MLTKSNIVGFIPSTNLDESKSFFEDKLGLDLITIDEFALEFNVGQIKLRITKVAEITPANYTLLGWEVDDIEATVKELDSKGIHFERYENMPQNDLSICTFPGGSKVAWFKDPEGNTLSITQF